MSIVSWCACHGITKANYYYRLRRVRKACLEAVQAEMPAQQMVPVQPELLQHQEQIGRNLRPGLDISIKGFATLAVPDLCGPFLEAALLSRHACF